MSYEEAIAIAANQHGCITRAQGLTKMTQRRWDRFVAQPYVRRLHPSVFVINGFSATWNQRAMAALLSIEGAALSHRAAARFWGFWNATSPLISITVPTKSEQKRHGVNVHTSMQLEPFVLTRHGMRVTSVARTLTDLSSCLSERELGRALDQACNMDLLKLTELDYCLERMVTKGRREISKIRSLLAERSTVDEKLDSFLERRTLQWLRHAGFGDVAGHHWVVANGTRYELDLAFPDAKVAIEPDGPHHLLPSVAEFDRRRDADLALEGWVVLHVYINSERTEVIDFAREALTRRRAIGV